MVAAALVAKLVVLGQLYDHPLLRPAGVLDTAAYFKLAQRAAAGDWAFGPGGYCPAPREGRRRVPAVCKRLNIRNSVCQLN